MRKEAQLNEDGSVICPEGEQTFSGDLKITNPDYVPYLESKRDLHSAYCDLHCRVEGCQAKKDVKKVKGEITSIMVKLIHPGGE